jgi:UDP-glucose 4-epimerase
MKKKILITGGQGFIGGRLAAYLCQFEEYDLVVTSRQQLSQDHKRPIKVINIDAKSDNITDVLKDCYAVIHLAALDATASFHKTYEAIEVNIADTLRWKIAAEEAGVAKFIYFSTIHVYGNQNVEILDESCITIPDHPYAITHLTAELYVLSSIYNKTTKPYVFRLSNSFGYPETNVKQWHLVVLDFCKQAIEKGEIIIKSNSSISRDFIPIDNICEIMNFTLQNDLKVGVYNMSTGSNKSLLELAKDIQEIMQHSYNKSIKIIEESEQKTMSSPIISNLKLKNEGYQHKEVFKNEISALINYCKNTFDSKW